MKKLFFLFLSAALLLNACGKEVQTEVTIESVDLSENRDLTFKFFLKRSDLGLSETDYKEWHEQFGGYVFDPPDEILAKFIYVSGAEDRELDSGTYCSEYFYPHDCTVNLEWNLTQPYLVKVTYENGDYSFTEVTVPVPEFMEVLEITAPIETPAQGSRFELSFKDIGADSYELRVANCNEYNNDGINPCLDAEEYTISMESGHPEILYYDWEDEYSLEPSVEISGDIITVRSNFELNFEDQVEYSVKARLSTEQGFNWMSDAAVFTR